MEELKEGLAKHYRKYKLKSSTSLTVNGKTEGIVVGHIKKVFKEVRPMLRNELTQEKFNLTFDKISKEQQNEIQKIYPVEMTRSQGFFDKKDNYNVVVVKCL